MIQVPDKKRTDCHILELDALNDIDADSAVFAAIAPYYQKKAQKKQSRKEALTEFGVGILLANVLNTTSDEAIVIDGYGKPSLTQKNIEIGISHAGNLVILGASSCRVGIDVEPLPEKIANYHYFALERAYGDQLYEIIDSVKRLTPYIFCKLWTQVEAAVKLDGRGLRLDPRENPQVISGAHFYTYEYKKHVITVATYEASDVKIMKGWKNG